MFIFYVTHELEWLFKTGSITSQHKASFTPLIRRYKSSHRVNNKILDMIATKQKNRCEESQFFLRVSAQYWRQTDKLSHNKRLFTFQPFRLATRLEPFVTFSLVIGRCRDVTVWVFYQTQGYYFRKSFDAKKSLKKVIWRTISEKEPLCSVVDGNLLVSRWVETPEKVTWLKETLLFGTIPNGRKRN